MGLIDFILNIAALLLWLNWLSVQVGAFAQPYSLAGTLKKAGTSFAYRWKFLAGLFALLLFRAFIYWQIGSVINWTPQIQLVAVNLPFRSHFFGRMLLFSSFSFLQTLSLFYLSLLLLSIVNKKSSDADQLHKLVRLHLGWFEKLPQFVKVFLPLILGGLVWWATNPVLVWINSVPQAKSATQVYSQAALIGAGAYLSWRFIIAAFLFFHLLNSYVYLGNHPVWNYVNVTSKNFLKPIRRLPLSYGRVDFAPVVVISAVFLVSEIASGFLHKFFPA